MEITSCELLSFCIFVIGHNTYLPRISEALGVVNCFLFVSLS